MSSKSTPVELHALVLVVLTEHKAWLVAELPSWPLDACSDTSATLIYDERLKPHLTMRRGWYVSANDERTPHTWLVGRNGLAKGWIFDPTIRQFDDTATSDVGMFPPGDQQFVLRK